jgi:iron complex outermembrane recepter protein
VSVSATYSYIRAKFREGILEGAPFTQQNVNIAGKTVPLVPRHKAALRASWTLLPETRLSALLSYVSDQFMDNDEPNTLGTKIPSYTLLDFKLTHRIGPWLLAASLNNVLNEKYYNYAVRSQFVADRYNVYPLPERNGLITLEYQIR